jgi:hypothetical protein
MLNVLADLRTERQRRTRDLLASMAAYGLGSAGRYLTSAPSPARAGKGLVTQVVRMSHEPKNLDLSALTSTSVSAYSVTVLNNVSQGSGGINRTGRQVLIESLRVQLIFQPASNNNAGDLVRVIIVRDKECRGVTPGLGDVLTNNTYGLSSLASSYNFDNVPSRFHMIHDELITLDPQSYFGVANYENYSFKPILINKKINAKTHFYNTNAGNVTDIDSGGIFMFVLNLSGSVQTEYQVDQRLIFRDL